MIVYHGSSMEIREPDVYHSRESVDFGKGFYITTIREQADKWATRFKRNDGKGIVTIYELDIEDCKRRYSILEFEGYTEEWLDFITACRKKKDKSTYDLIIGGVANDKVFNTIELYFSHLIEKKEAITRLQYQKPNLQLCIRKQNIIDECIRFYGSEEI
ncbi:MAG: DUF3990 domain-containing protein [Lachnospiraceae bacterium]|nr:DUF3990 domain-containing protein [Lachnospiraceae bacterium]